MINKAPISARALLLVRFLVCLQFLYLCIWGQQIFSLEYFQIENLKTIYSPKSLFFALSLPFPSALIFGLCKYLFFIGLIGFMLGVLPRLISVLTAVLGLYVVGFTTQFGYESHLVSPLLLVICFLSVMKLPSLMDFMKNQQVRDEKAEHYQIYLTCLKLIWISVFFNAGMEKLKISGLDYFLSDKHINSIIISRLFHTDLNSSSTLEMAQFLLSNFHIHYLFGLGLFLELLSPLALFRFKASRTIVLGIAGMQLMIFIMMELKHIFYYFPLYLLFLDDERLRRLEKSIISLLVRARENLFH